MQLTRFTDYSLRVPIFLAHRQGIHTTIKDVSDAHQISEDHLMKVVRRLATLGYIKTTRGKNGGVGSARAPADISIGAVIRDVEVFTPVECFTPCYDGRCLLYPNCALRSALESAQLQYLKTLDAYSVADVMGFDPLEGRRFSQNGPGAIPPRSSARRTGRTPSRLRARVQ
jgi:Rrf2 family transcriptional regulator, nitric oxide-sensitive transcriptional repressor